MKLLTNKKQESIGNAKICYICKEKFEDKYLKKKLKINIWKIRNIVKLGNRFYCTGEYRGAADSICNLMYSVPKKVPIVFHSRSNYDYHFITKELAEEFEKQLTCLGDNSEKYITFIFPIEN